MADVVDFPQMPKVMAETWQECGDALRRIPDAKKLFLIMWVEPDDDGNILNGDLKMNWCTPSQWLMYGYLEAAKDTMLAWQRGYLRVEDPFEESE